jgi:hypothetical protein
MRSATFRYIYKLRLVKAWLDKDSEVDEVCEERVNEPEQIEAGKRVEQEGENCQQNFNCSYRRQLFVTS